MGVIFLTLENLTYTNKTDQTPGGFSWKPFIKNKYV